MKLRTSLSLAALAFAGACGEASLGPSVAAPEAGPSFAFASVTAGAVRVQNAGCVSDIVATVPGELPFFVGIAPHCIRATLTADGGEALYFVWFNNGGLTGNVVPKTGVAGTAEYMAQLGGSGIVSQGSYEVKLCTTANCSPGTQLAGGSSARFKLFGKQFKITSAPLEIEPNECAALLLQKQNANGTATTEQMAITLAARLADGTPTSGTFYDNGTCSGAAVTNVVFTGGQSARTLSYKDAADGPRTLVVLDGNLFAPGSHALNVNGADATTLESVGGTGTYGGTATLTATLKSGATLVSGKTVEFSVNGTAVCGNPSPACPTTDGSGVATLSGVSLAGIGAGTHTNAVEASFAGDADYLPSTNTGDLVVAQASLTVSVVDAADAPYNKTIIFGGTVPAFFAKYDGFVAGDDQNDLGGTLVFTPNPSATYPGVGTYAIEASGLTSTNYDISYVDGALTIEAWTLSGFFAPVKAGFNTVNTGATVPLKFRVFAGDVEQTTLAAVQGFTVTKLTTCTVGSGGSPVAFETTGGTTLRYDADGGQFVQNWKVPGEAGCYMVTMTSADNSTIVAYFRTR